MRIFLWAYSIKAIGPSNVGDADSLTSKLASFLGKTDLPCEECEKKEKSSLEFRELILATNGMPPANFKLEFDLHISQDGNSSSGISGSAGGSMTFYHPALIESPVSAISALSQNL
jgi:hypothetical protein